MNEYRVIMTGIVGLCGLGLASAVSPTVERITDVVFGVLFGTAAVVVLGFVGREVWRELRFRAEMRALDLRDAQRAAMREGARR